MKIQKTLVAAVALALAGAAYAGNDKNKSMTSAQESAQPATQQQASSDSSMQPSATANGQSGSSQAGDETVRQLQQQLKDKGFDPGPVDGIDGPKTQAALRKSQEAGGMNAAATSDVSTGSSMPSYGPSSSDSTSATTSSQPSTDTSTATQPK